MKILNAPGTRLISGAAVHGSCFAQVAGNLKRQQFVLSSFSQQEVFEQACAMGDRGGFVTVCKTIYQNTQHENEFRGCGVAVPKQYIHLSHAALLAPDDDSLQEKSKKQKKEQSGEIADGNLCNINKPEHSSNVSSDDVPTPSSSFITFSPIYELVAPKKLSGKDDEWLYMIAGDNSKEKTAVASSSVAGAAATAVVLNEAVSHLSKGESEQASALLSKYEDDHTLESLSMLKRFAGVVKKIREISVRLK